MLGVNSTKQLTINNDEFKLFNCGIYSHIGIAYIEGFSRGRWPGDEINEFGFAVVRI